MGLSTFQCSTRRRRTGAVAGVEVKWLRQLRPQTGSWFSMECLCHLVPPLETGAFRANRTTGSLKTKWSGPPNGLNRELKVVERQTSLQKIGSIRKPKVRVKTHQNRSLLRRNAPGCPEPNAF